MRPAVNIRYDALPLESENKNIKLLNSIGLSTWSNKELVCFIGDSLGPLG